MIIVVAFLIGIVVGALLSYHLGNVAELRRKVQAHERERDGSGPDPRD
jgi:hypothetical protein